MPRPVAHRVVAAAVPAAAWDAAPLPEKDRLRPQRGVVHLGLRVVVVSSPPPRPYPLQPLSEPDVLHRKAPPRWHGVRHQEHRRDRPMRPDLDDRDRAGNGADIDLQDVVPHARRLLQIAYVNAAALGRVAWRRGHLRSRRGAGCRANTAAAAVALAGPGGSGGAASRPGA